VKSNLTDPKYQLFVVSTLLWKFISRFIYLYKIKIVNSASTQDNSKNSHLGFSLEILACNFELTLFSTPFAVILLLHDAC